MKKLKKTKRIVFIETRRLILSPLSREDLQYFEHWYNDREVAQYLLSHDHPTMREREEEWYEQAHKRRETAPTLVIVRKDESRAIGCIGLRPNYQHRFATLGIAIGDKDSWSQGFGREAIMHTLRYGFDSLNLRTVVLDVLGNNRRGKRCYERCGFKVAGILKSHLYKNGTYVDEVIMRITKKRWRKRWKRYQHSLQ